LSHHKLNTCQHSGRRVIENKHLTGIKAWTHFRVNTHTDAWSKQRKRSRRFKAFNVGRVLVLNRPIPVYRFPRRALKLCPQLCMGIQPGARFPARSADALLATLYGHFIQAIYRNRPITPLPACGCEASSSETFSRAPGWDRGTWSAARRHRWAPSTRGLHSSTFRLNLSSFPGTCWEFW